MYKIVRRQSDCQMLGWVVIYKALCFDVAQGRMNGAPNETIRLGSNLQSSLLRCGTRPNEWGAQ